MGKEKDIKLIWPSFWVKIVLICGLSWGLEPSLLYYLKPDVITKTRL